MTNTKARQRHRVILEFGILFQPLVSLREAQTIPQDADYRLAVSKVLAGEPQWREGVMSLADFGDFKFEHDASEISHLPERTRLRIYELIKKGVVRGVNDYEIHQPYVTLVSSAIEEFFQLIERIPVTWEPDLFSANTPFTSYLKILEATAHARVRLHYTDRYLGATFFDLFLRDLPKTLEVRLVTTAKGIRNVRAASDLFKQECPNFWLVEVDHTQLHDRNLRVDDQVFSLGPGLDRAGLALTNFTPAASTAAAHDELDRLISGGTIVVGP